MYKKVSSDLSFVDREKAIEKFWRDNKIFEKSIECREGTRRPPAAVIVTDLHRPRSDARN